MHESSVPTIEQIVAAAENALRARDGVAARDCLDALRQSDDIRILRLRAEAAELDQNWIDAANIRSVIVARDPLSITDCCQLAFSLRRAGQFAAADRALEPLLSRIPHCIPALTAYAWNAHEDKTSREAVKRWRTLLKHSPGDVSSSCCLVAALTQHNEFEQAEELANDLLRRFPLNEQVASVSAWISHARGEWPEAVVRWKRVVELAPQKADAYACLGTAFRHIGSFDDAEAAFSEARKIAPDNLLFQIEYAAIARDGGNPAESERRWLDLRKRYSGDTAATGTIGYHYSRHLLRIIDSEGYSQLSTDSITVSDSRDLFMAFESLGDNCEFGDIQRRFGAEPLGLLRFVQINPPDLIRALEERFEGIGMPENVTLRVNEHGEYIVNDSKYRIEMHTFVSASEISEHRFTRQILRRIAYLREKILADLAENHKIFVYKSRSGLTQNEIQGLWRAINLYDGQQHLVCVCLADDTHVAGSVETPAVGLIIGYVTRFAFAQGFVDCAIDDWVKVCEQAYIISSQWRAGRSQASNDIGQPSKLFHTDNQHGDRRGDKPMTNGGATLLRDTDKRRRFLVFVRCGSRSLVSQWFREDAPRNWDLMLSYYDAKLSDSVQSAEIVVEGGLSKFHSVFDIHRSNPEVISSYDAVLFLDDDILIAHERIDVLFSIFSDNKMLLAQPALTPDSFLCWPITKIDQDCEVRFTNFVEIMMPLMAREAFLRCVDTFCECVSGWGLDYVWPKLLGYETDKIGIIDAVAATHTQPIDVTGGRFYKYLQSLDINPVNEADQLLIKYGLNKADALKPKVVGTIPSTTALVGNTSTAGLSGRRQTSQSSEPSSKLQAPPHQTGGNVTAEFLTTRLWEFGHKSGFIATTKFRLMEDGTIANHEHENERNWSIANGVLCLLNREGIVTVRFDEQKILNDRVTFFGRHLPNPDITLYLSEQKTDWPPKPERPQMPGTKSHLLREIRDLGWEIGDHTYGNPTFIERGRAKLKVGKYVSIAEGVKIAFGDHRMDVVSTYPFIELERYWPSAPKEVTDHVSKGDVLIGNDVWIGAGAFILSGITIGDGAVIGANCVVTKNVPPYGIVVGNPGRLVRYRFSQEVISELLSIAWWDWPDEMVDSYLPLMMSTEIDKFLAAAPRKVVAANSYC